MKNLIKVVAVITTIMFAFEFIACSNPSSSPDGTSGGSSSGGGNSNSSTYTTVAGGTYINSLSNSGFAFNDDYSVNMITASSNSKINGSKWRIVNGNTVEIYVEGMDTVSNTFTANSTFTELTVTSYGTSVVYTRQ